MCVGCVRVWQTSILVHVVCLVSVVSVCASVGVVCGCTGVYEWGCVVWVCV